MDCENLEEPRTLEEHDGAIDGKCILSAARRGAVEAVLLLAGQSGGVTRSSGLQ
jgi:hypothetical protein